MGGPSIRFGAFLGSGGLFWPFLGFFKVFGLLYALYDFYIQFYKLLYDLIHCIVEFNLFYDNLDVFIYFDDEL